MIGGITNEIKMKNWNTNEKLIECTIGKNNEKERKRNKVWRLCNCVYNMFASFCEDACVFWRIGV